MSHLPDFDDYSAAMQQHAAKTLRVEMNVLQLTMLISTLQLALRHPDYPEGMRAIVEDFLDGAIDNLTRLSPIIGATMLAGNDPTQDGYPWEETP